MNDRREAIVGKFRASALERLRRLSLLLGEMAAGESSSDGMTELRRELHTLKGEATMLDFAPMAEVIHAAEDHLARAVKAGPEALRIGAEVMATELEVLIRWLRGDFVDEHAGLSTLTVARDVLVGVSKQIPAAAPSANPEPMAVLGSQPLPQPAGHASAASRGAETPEVVAPRRAPERWVQVGAQRIDQLCERASDFEIGFRALYYRLRELSESGEALDRGVRAILSDFDRAQSTLEDITTTAWALRLVPVEPVLAELVAYAQQIAQSQGKKLRVVVHGRDAQLERSVLDMLWEPLVHLVRNAVDHGVEPPAERQKKGEAVLRVDAEAVGANVVLSISDNGRGIDTTKVREVAVERGLITREAATAMTDVDVQQLLFVHGFSTRAEVSELSGRGIGLDVVRSSAESIGGFVTVTSELGQGTRFTLTLPATISKERTLVFRARGALYGIPSRAIPAVVSLDEVKVEDVAGGRAVRHGDEMIPLRSMTSALSFGEVADEPWAVVLDSGLHRWAFSVERTVGEFALLRRPTDRLVSASALVNGSAILEDGRIVLLLAVASLVRQSESKGTAPRAAAPTPTRQPRVLIVDDSAVVRDLMMQILSTAGLLPVAASGGEQALALFAEARPDAVLLDVDMPGVDGFEVLRRIRMQSHDVPIVMLTLRASAADQMRASTLGANAYVVKSQFRETTLLDTLRRFIEAS